MKVVHLATGLHGGAGNAAYRIHESLVSIGVDSNIVTISSPEEFGNDPRVFVLKRNKLQSAHSSSLTLLQSLIVQNSSSLTTSFSLNSISFEEEMYAADVIHLHNTYNLLNYKYIDRFSKSSKIVATLHDQRMFTGACHYSFDCRSFIDGECTNCPQVRIPYRSMVHKNLSKTKRALSSTKNLEIVSPSHWLMELSKQSTALSERNHFVIRNPASQTFINKAKEVRIHNKSIRIGFSATNLMNPFKGLAILFRAISLVSNSVWLENLELVLIGSGQPREIPDGLKVTIVHATNEYRMREALESVDLLVIPSVQDNFPNLISEALLSGCELITSDAGGLPELSVDFGYKTFPSGDSSKLAQLLLAYTPDSANREKRINAARKVFSPSSIAQAYKEVYEN